jgi:outer membrane receptor protein involved in Fe transport
MSNRSAADSPVPVDVIGGEEFRQNSSSDVQDMLRTNVPSFDVNTQPISDVATIVRPANMRGLSPDNVLVLVNGKRRHRGSIISFLGGGISDGAQGVDISAIPSLALKQVEVLRDGASSQYGSDAIAGVLNFMLRDNDEGFEFRANYYGGWDDTGNGVDGIDAAILIDVEAKYSYSENLDLVVGVNNLFDEYPEENPSVGSLGQLYSESSPFGFNGGMWYVQARYTY